MPPLNMLSVPPVSITRKLGLSALWVYSAVAMALVAVKITQVALGH
jgi:hypothetical protein